MARKKGYYWVIIATSNQEKIAYCDGENWDLLNGAKGMYNDNMIKKIGAWVGDSFMREKANEILPRVINRCPHCNEEVGYLNYKKHLYMNCCNSNGL